MTFKSNARWRRWAKALPPYLDGPRTIRFNPELDAKIIAAIRACHLKANIDNAERDRESSIVFWDEAWIDPGGTIFGEGPYLKVPVISRLVSDTDKLPRRVYPPARLRRKLARLIAESQQPKKSEAVA